MEKGTGCAMSWESDLPRPESGDSQPAPASAPTVIVRDPFFCLIVVYLSILVDI